MWYDFRGVWACMGEDVILIFFSAHFRNICRSKVGERKCSLVLLNVSSNMVKLSDAGICAGKGLLLLILYNLLFLVHLQCISSANLHCKCAG